MTFLGWGKRELKPGSVQSSEFWSILGRGDMTIGISYSHDCSFMLYTFCDCLLCDSTFPGKGVSPGNIAAVGVDLYLNGHRNAQLHDDVFIVSLSLYR